MCVTVGGYTLSVVRCFGESSPFFIVFLVQPLLCGSSHALSGKKKFGPDERMAFTEERNGRRTGKERVTCQVVLWLWLVWIMTMALATSDANANTDTNTDANTDTRQKRLF